MVDKFDPAMRHLAIAKELAEKYGVPNELKAEIERSMELIVAREAYCTEICHSPSPALKNIIDSTWKHPWDEVYVQGKTSWKISPLMVSGNIEGQFLKSIVSMSKAKRVLELGLFTGCSALAIAEALPQDGVVYSCEIEPYIADMARELLDKSNHGSKVNIHRGSAMEGIRKLAQEKIQVDVVFIDADKDNYINYLNEILQLDILAPGGTIVVDNALMFGYPYAKENYFRNSSGRAIEKFNEMVVKASNLHKVLLPVRDGIMLIRRLADVNR